MAVLGEMAELGDVAAYHQTDVTDGEQVQGTWVHDMASLKDVAAQGASLQEWSKKIAAETKKK